MNKNKLFRQIHIYLSLFFLPCAIIYAITGISYISGFDQDSGATKQVFSVDRALEKGNEAQMIVEILTQNGAKIPSDTSLKNGKGGVLTMGGAHYSVSAKNVGEGAQITTIKRSILGDLIMLHKDKGKWYFGVLGVGFGVCLVLLYLSGLMITIVAIKRERKPQLITLLAGVVVTFILAYLSL